MSRRNDGFTLIELLMALALFVGVLVAISSGMLHITRAYQQGQMVRRVQQNARNIMEDITRSGRNSNFVGYDESGTRKLLCFSSAVYLFDSGAAARNSLIKYFTDPDVNCDADANFAPLRSQKSQLVEEGIKVLGFNILPPSEAALFSRGEKDVQFNVVMGPDSDDLLVGESCDPSAIGSHFCAIADYTSIVKPRRIE